MQRRRIRRLHTQGYKKVIMALLLLCILVAYISEQTFSSDTAVIVENYLNTKASITKSLMNIQQSVLNIKENENAIVDNTINTVELSRWLTVVKQQYKRMYDEHWTYNVTNLQSKTIDCGGFVRLCLSEAGFMSFSTNSARNTACELYHNLKWESYTNPNELQDGDIVFMSRAGASNATKQQLKDTVINNITSPHVNSHIQVCVDSLKQTWANCGSQSSISDHGGEPYVSTGWTSRFVMGFHLPITTSGAIGTVSGGEVTIKKHPYNNTTVGSDYIPKKLNGKTVSISAGHFVNNGSFDSGAICGCGSNVNESTTVYNMAVKAAEKLAAEGYFVYLVRDTDDWNSGYRYSYKERIAIINQTTKSDLCMELHWNSSTNKNVAGFICFYPCSSSNPVQAESRRLCESFASIWRQETGIGMCGTGVSPTKSDACGNRTLAFVDNATCPVALLETGFCSNSTECQFLHSQAGYEKVANAILRGVNKYFGL